MENRFLATSLVAALAACSTPTPQLAQGDGVSVAGGKIAVDDSKVPFLGACDPDGIPTRTPSSATGWTCVSPGSLTVGNAAHATTADSAATLGGQDAGYYLAANAAAADAKLFAGQDAGYYLAASATAAAAQRLAGHEGADYLLATDAAAKYETQLDAMNFETSAHAVAAYETQAAAAGIAATAAAAIPSSQAWACTGGKFLSGLTGAGAVTCAAPPSVLAGPGIAVGGDGTVSATAGKGIIVDGNGIQVAFAGSGSAFTAARSDHTHAAVFDVTNAVYTDAVRDRLAQASKFHYRSSGFVDTFADQSGVSTTNTSGAAYNPASNWFTNITGVATSVSNINQWNTANNASNYWVVSGTTVQRQAVSSSNYGLEGNVADLTGDFDYSYTQPGDSGTAVEWQFGVVVDCCATTAGFDWSGLNLDVYWIGHPGVGSGRLIQIRHGNTSVVATVTQDIAQGDTFLLRRVGNTLTALHNGVTLYTWTSFTTNAVYRGLGQGVDTGSKSIAFNNVGWTVAKAAGPMTLLSSAVTASAAPRNAYLAIRERDVDAVTVNTDLLAFVTCQDTSAFQQVTLTSTPYAPGENLYLGQLPVSCSTGNTTMRYKLLAQNNKAMRIEGVALDWQ